MDEISELSRLFHNHLIEKARPETPTIERVADLMGISPVSVYKILEGERSLKAEDLPRFYKFTGKPIDILIWLVEKCDCKLALVSLPDEETNGEILDEIMDVNIHLGKLCEMNQRALADATYDEDEIAGVRKMAMKIRGDAERIINELNHSEMMKETK